MKFFHNLQSAGTLAVTATLSIAVAAHAMAPTDVDDNVEALKSLAKAPLHTEFVDSLKAGSGRFQDYQCFCKLYIKKDGRWKDAGGAQFAYKFRNLFKAVIKSSDYRNGSVVARGPEGVIRGAGGGTLRFMKMTLQPDSRTLKLPTGYSLADSDFLSLYEALKTSLKGGGSGFVSSSAVTTKLFPDPVNILLVTKPGAASVSEAVIVDPKTKAPILWTVFKDGQPSALVLFQDVQLNKGLDDSSFSL